ncbi:hypothetical protein HDZ31DRAFT_61821 [Schizophyllum fasciatum]
METSAGRLHIFNIYSACENNSTLEHFRAFLDRHQRRFEPSDTNHMLWTMDANRHHPMWDDDGNSHLFTNSAIELAQVLIDLVGQYDMVMALPKGIPTLQHMATKRWSRPDNTFISEDAAALLISCDTAPSLRGPGTDHMPILTELDFALARQNSPSYRNFRETDWDEFESELSARLRLIDDPKEIMSADQFHTVLNGLTGAILATIDKVVPLSKPCPHSRRWWTKELTQMSKKLNRLAEVAHRYRALPGHASHGEYTAYSQIFSAAIEEAKRTHWEEFLDEGLEADMWTASRYCSEPSTDSGKTRIPTLKASGREGGGEMEATSNQEKAQVLSSSFFPPKPPDFYIPPTTYPEPLPDPPPIHLEQIRRHVRRLKPYKMYGSDGIQNIVLKKCLHIIENHLLHLFRAVISLDVYSDDWRECTTVVLRKPGRARYDIAKSYRPIALLNTIPKVLAAIMAENLVQTSLEHELLPRHHFGGLPGRSTTDALHLIVNRIKNAWRRKRVVTILATDVQGAFSNMVIERLLHNMRMRRAPNAYTRYLTLMFANRHTRLRFDDFTSDPIPIDNGGEQGNPIMMILYLYYNADLVDLAKDDNSVDIPTFVDDANLIIEGADFTETTAKAQRIMERDGGGFSWSKTHNSSFELDKFAVMHCEAPLTRQRRTRPELRLRGQLIKEVEHMRTLGVMIDRHLTWRVQADYSIGRGTDYVLAYRRLAKSRAGLDSRFMRTLYEGVAEPKMTYGLEVWYVPVHRVEGQKRDSGSVGYTRRFAKIQRTAALAITGALRTSPNDLVDLHANILPADLLLSKIIFRTTARLCTLPSSHPLHPVVQRCTRYVQKHRSAMHEALHLFKLRPADVETITPARCPPSYIPPYSTSIAANKEDAKMADETDRALLRVYSDGSGYNGKAGASAVLFRRGRSGMKALRYQLGSLSRYGTYEAELVGKLLAVHLLRNEAGAIGARSRTVVLDNTSALTAAERRSAKSGQHLVEQLVDDMQKLHGSSPKLVARWAKSHIGIHGNELADEEAKRAAEGESSPDHLLPDILRTSARLPYSISALKQKHNKDLRNKWKERWNSSPRHARIHVYEPAFPFTKFTKIARGLKRNQHNVVVQLRINHIPLRAYLHKVRKADTADCPSCATHGRHVSETTHHFLFDCPAYRTQRQGLTNMLGRHARNFRTLLGTKGGIIALLRYIAHTKRLTNIYGDVASFRPDYLEE